MKIENLEKLIDKIFEKSLLVESKEKAYEISKNKRMNCVTHQGEVYFSGSYLAKIGFMSVT